MSSNKRILHLIEQAGSLMLMPRTHIRSLGNTFDNVASHSFHTSIIAYCIARMEGLTHQDGIKAMTMATLHDLAESRTGDLDFIAKNYCKDDEEKAIKDSFSGISFGKDLEEISNEYEERKSLVSKCAKDADSLEQIFLEWRLMWQGNKLAEKWFVGDFVNRVPNLNTESAKKISMEMKNSNPNEWWSSEFLNKQGKVKNLRHLMGKGFKK